MRRRRAFVITDTELKLIAAAAIIGLSNSPKNGYRIPAAIGTPSEVVASGAYAAIREHTHTHGHLRHDHPPHERHAEHPEVRP